MCVVFTGGLQVPINCIYKMLQGQGGKMDIKGKKALRTGGTWPCGTPLPHT